MRNRKTSAALNGLERSFYGLPKIVYPEIVTALSLKKDSIKTP